MKKPLEIFAERLQIDKEKEEINELERANFEKLFEVQKECGHEIVLKFHDHKPHKMLYYDCVCPACKKLEMISQTNSIEKTDFKNSKILDLTHLQEEIVRYKYGSVIQDWIIDNYDICYGKSSALKEEELTELLRSEISFKMLEHGLTSDIFIEVEQNVVQLPIEELVFTDTKKSR